MDTKGWILDGVIYVMLMFSFSQSYDASVQVTGLESANISSLTHIKDVISQIIYIGLLFELYIF